MTFFVHEHDGFELRVETEPTRANGVRRAPSDMSLVCYRSCEFDPLTLVRNLAWPAKLLFDPMA